ncbi:MAG: penicillin-insensitive murein endopeptidase [Aliihoeflea sp.]|uniref:penicillin-insensitive murein endopeptidase n=1 Tax=Aliihoeflea sp. TaxID=2608088 RepID=UPI004033C4D1
MRARNWIKAACVALSMTAATSADAQLAKDLFGNQPLPAAAEARVYGSYSKGCFAGGMAIANDGPNWQTMRPSRNRRWGHPDMVRLVERLSRDATADGWPGLLVGDISQPRGGPMLSGHASHQLGLDADIWFQPMPQRRLSTSERENLEFVSMLRDGELTVDDRKWSPAHAGILRRAASYREVERILVHPGIKKKLCETVTGDRSWLGKVRPFWGHDSHFHIRIGCPAGSPGCRPQEGIGRGDGCDSSLAWWFTDEPWRPATGPQQPRARDVMRMADLPRECSAVLQAPAPQSEAMVTIGGPGSTIGQTVAPPIAANAYAPTPESAIPVPFPRPQP